MEKKNKNQEGLSYYIGIAIGFVASKLFLGLFDLVKAGIVTASKKHDLIKWLYIILGICMFVSLVAYQTITVIGTITLVCAVCLGIWVGVDEYPERAERQKYAKIFEEIKLTNPVGTPPLYICEKKNSDYSKTIAFGTTIPIKEWQKKMDNLEIGLNKNVIDIKQDEDDKTVTLLTIQTYELPKSITWNDKYIEASGNKLSLGVGYNGVAYLDLERYPHSFIAGETGSGKSNILKCLIYQSLVKEYDVILIDFKRGISFSSFSDIVDIYYEHMTTLKTLEGLVEETNKRLDLFREYKVDNLNDYNELGGRYMYRKIVFVDELAELLKIRDKEISNRLYDSIETLTKLSRSVGIHLIMGIQRPDSSVMNGQIKSNVSFRMCERFVDREPSRIMLSSDKASLLPNIKGRFIVKDNDMQEIQSFYYPDAPVSHLKRVRSDGTGLVEEEPKKDIKVTEKEVKSENKGIDFDFSEY